MRAISKINHDRFCKMIQEMRLSHSLDDGSLVKLESELEAVFATYSHFINEVKAVMMEYHAKEKAIRHQVKLLIQNQPPKSWSRQSSRQSAGRSVKSHHPAIGQKV